MDQEDYQEPLENLDASLEETTAEPTILSQILRDTADNLLTAYRSQLNDKDNLDSLKKELSKVKNVEAKDYFYKELWNKLLPHISLIIEGKQDLKKLKQSGILQLLLLTEITSKSLNQQIFKTLHQVLQKETSVKGFSYLLKILHKVAKHLDKRDQLLAQLFSLYKNLKQRELNNQFAMTDKFCKETNQLEAKSNSEQRVLLMLLILNYMTMNKLHSNFSIEQFKKTMQIIKTQPYNSVLDYYITSWTKNKPFLRNIINCEFSVVEGVAKYKFNQVQLHPELETRQTYLKALVNSPEKIYQQLRKQNFIVYQDKLYCKMSLNSLKKIFQQPKLDTGQYMNETLKNMIEVLKFLLANSTKTIQNNSQKMQEQKSEQNVNRYIVYIWNLFTRYFYDHERNQFDTSFLFQNVNVDFLQKMLNKSLEIIETTDGESFAEELVKVIVHLYYKGQYANVSNHSTETSLLVAKVLLKMKQFPTKWRSLKKLKALLDKWGEGMTVIPPNFLVLINKFIDAFFDPLLRLKSRSFPHFDTSSTQYRKAVGNAMGLKIKQVLSKSFQKLNNIGKKEQKEREQQKNNLNLIIYKMACLYLSRSRITDNEGIADILFRIYQNYAPDASFIYTFRTWILDYSIFSKDGNALGTVTKFTNLLIVGVKDFCLALDSIAPSELLKPFRKSKQILASSQIQQFTISLKILVNNLQLKTQRDIFGEHIYQNLLSLSQTLSKAISTSHRKILEYNEKNSQKINQICFQTQLSKQNSIYSQIVSAYTSFIYVIRFYLCNMNRIINVNDQLYLLRSVAELIKLFVQPANTCEVNLKLVNDLLGFNNMEKGNLESWQILSMQAGSRNAMQQYYFNKQQYTPLIVVSTLYSKLRNDFIKITKNLISAYHPNKISFITKKLNYASDFSKSKDLSRLLNNQYSSQRVHLEAQTVINNIVLPSINVFGPSYYNNKFEEKGREEQAFGILLDQFNLLFGDKLSAKQIASLQPQLTNFFEICRDKARKVINKQMTQPQRQSRRNPMNQAHRAQMLNQLGLMGYQPEVVQFALEHVIDNDPEALINWLQENNGRINELMMNRVMERSRTESVPQFNKKVQQVQKIDIPLVSYEQLKKNIEAGTKGIIKLLKNELFSQLGIKLKDLIFICLDSFQKQQFKNKQLDFFLGLMFTQLDKLNNTFSDNTLQIVVSSIENIIVRKPDTIIKLHEKMITNKLLSFLQKANFKGVQRILSIINLSLPNPPQNCSKRMIDYLNYIGDIMLNTDIAEKSTVSMKESDILCKMVKAKDPAVNDKVLKILCKGLSRGLLKEKFFSLLTIILDSDKQFCSANIQLQLKSHIIQNYPQTKPQKYIKIDPKKFGVAFAKYEQHPLFAQTVKKVLVKMDRKLVFDTSKHSLYKSQILNCNFMSYNLNQNHQVLMQNLVNQIVNQTNAKNRLDYLKELHKSLEYYKILVPFCMRLKVGDGNFMDWLVQKQFPVSKGQILPFISFLFLRNGLYLNQNQTFADYMACQLLSKHLRKPQQQQTAWEKLLLLYLLPQSSINSIITTPLSSTSPINLKSALQQNLSISAQPITSYILNSESLYIILKKQLLDKLEKENKYKIDANDQSQIQKQFLNMDLYYARKKSSGRLGLEDIEGEDRGRSSLGRLFASLTGEGLGEENDDMEALQVLRRMLLLRERQSDIVPSSNNIRSIFVPVQPPPAQTNQQQQNQQNQSQSQPAQQSQQSEQQSSERQQQTNQQKTENIPITTQIEVEKQSQKISKNLSQIIQRFSQIFPQHPKPHMQQQWKLTRIPESGLQQSDLKNANYTSNLKQPKVTTEPKIHKVNIFKDRIIQIAEIVDPNEKMIIGDERKQLQLSDIQERQRFMDFRRNQIGGLSRHFLGRMNSGDRDRDSRPAAVYNVNRLLGAMEEYREPKPEEPKEQKKQNENKETEKKEVQKKQEEKVQQKAQKMVEQKSQEKAQKMQDQSPSNKQKGQNQVEKKDQNKMEDAIESNRQEQGMVEVKPEQSVMDEEPNQVQPNIQPNQLPQGQQVPISQPASLPVEQIVQPAQQQMVEEPHRQILAMMGLPQTFLRDLGIDTFSFDCLPQDMQIQQLNFFMQQQNTANRNNRPNQQNQQNQNQGNNPTNPQNQMSDLQNQNAAFIQSLDPQLRAQTLMQAAPDFLATLPPAMRAEAENYRSRHIMQLMRDEEMQFEQRQNTNKRAPKVLVYPQLTPQNFPQINTETAKKLSQSLLLKIPKFNHQSFKILLQNKKTQTKALTTLISYIRNIDQLNLTQCTYNSTEQKWDKQMIQFNAHTRKVFIDQLLAIVENYVNGGVYRDEGFLDGKVGYEGYGVIGMEVNRELGADQQGYYPLYELLELSIDNHNQNLSSKLIKKVKDLPQSLLKKLSRGIIQNRFSNQFYSNLQNLSNNSQLKQIFLQQFNQHKQISLQKISRVIKYNFAKVPQLKQLHIKALKNCKGTPSQQIQQCLNQVFCAYTTDDVKQLEPLLIQNKQVHYHIIKYLYQSGRSLENQPIGLILKFPHLLDFQTKRFIFQRNPKLHKSRQRCIIQVNRLNLFQQSFNQIMNKSLKQLEGSLKVVFMDEQAEDAGGPKKQWFLKISKQIFDPRYALFQPSSSGNTYQPNPKSYVNTEHLSYFKFIGRFFAKALCQGMLIDAFFTRSFYKMILGHQLQLKDLEQQDYGFYKSMVWMKQNPMSQDEEYYYSYTHNYFGKIIVKELIPGGETIKVTEENKLDYIHKYSMAMMRDAIGAQIGKFLQGFYQILPKELISFFEPTELQLLMSGMPSVDLKDMKLNTDYQGYSPNDQVIKWYWQILQEYTNEDLARLVQFITGTSKIPLQGFSKLQGMHGAQKISIHKDCHIDQLPKSHTCFNQLDLPNYPTKEMLKQRLRVAITWGSEGFGFM